MTHACHKQISRSFCWYLLSDGSSAPSCSWATKCHPVSSTSVIHMADTAIITRPTDRPPHGFSGILNSQRCNCLMPTRKASALDLFKSGCDFISKQQNKSGKTHDRYKHAKRLCQPSMNLQTFFLIFYFFIVLLLVF